MQNEQDKPQLTTTAVTGNADGPRQRHVPSTTLTKGVEIAPDKPQQEKIKRQRKPNIKERYPAVNYLFMFLLCLECLGVFYFYSREDIILVLILFLATAIMLAVVRKTAEYIGLYLSSLTKKNHLRASKTSLKKWNDQGWQFFLHVSMSIWNLMILYQVDFIWWNNPNSLFESCSDQTPGHDHALSSCMEQEISPNVRLYYMAQLGLWGYTAFHHAFFDEVRKDYFAMYGHHLVTVALIFSSYLFHYTRIGVLVLIIHDVSDIFLDFLKLSHYLDVDLAVFITFVINMISWIYFRLYQFPFRVIHAGLFTSIALVPNGKWWALSNALLIILQILHVYWFQLLARIAVELITGTTPKKAGEQEYEGSASESERE